VTPLRPRPCRDGDGRLVGDAERDGVIDPGSSSFFRRLEKVACTSSARVSELAWAMDVPNTHLVEPLRQSSGWKRSFRVCAAWSSR
jgi:hypothetical protein